MPLDPRTELVGRTARAGDRIAEAVADLRRRVKRIENSARLSSQTSGAWVDAALVNGFADFGAGTAPAAYYKDGLGRVYLRGNVACTSSGVRPITIFTLAAGYRPVFTHRFVCAGEFADSVAECIVDVNPNGTVQLSFSGFTSQAINLDEISFRTI